MCIFVDIISLFGSTVVSYVLKNRASFSRFTFSLSSGTICVNIDTLPDELLLLIFDRIPLSNLLQLDQVCPRWAMLQSSAAVRRRTLVLLVGGHPVEQLVTEIPFNNNFEISNGVERQYYNLPVSERDAIITLPYLVPSSFDDFLLDGRESDGFFGNLFHTIPDGQTEEEDFTEMARLHNALLYGRLMPYLVALFPNVDTLVLIHPKCYDGELHSVIDLLECSWSLVSLKLWLFNWDIDKSYLNRPKLHPIGALLRTINRQQTSLRHVSLNFGTNGTSTMRFSFPREWFSFIGRLKVAQLYLDGYDRDNAIWDIVHRLDSANLRQIGLGNVADLLVNLAHHSKFNFTTKVSHLYYYRHFDTVQQLNQLCMRYSNLTLLGIALLPGMMRIITFTLLVTNLSSLRQLTHLRMFIRFEGLPENLFALTDGGGTVDGHDEEPRRISLPQVKILEFNIYKRSHRDFESLPSFVFPSVEAIFVDEYDDPRPRCTVCRRFAANGLFEDGMGGHCYRLMVRSLKSKLPLLSGQLKEERIRIVKFVLLYLSFIYCINKTV